MSALKNIDTSDELLISRFGHGIKLTRPNQYNTKQNFPKHDTQHTVSSMLKLPLSVYFIRADSINERVNEDDAKLCDFDSVQNAQGKKCFSKFTQKSAEITTQNDKEVMRFQKITHIYHTPAEEKASYVPAGEIYVKFKEGTPLTTREEILKKYELTKRKMRGELAFIAESSNTLCNSLEITTSLQGESSIEIAEPDLVTLLQKR